MEQKKFYIVGLLMNPDMDDGAEMHDEDFVNYAYTDFNKAGKEFEKAMEAMTGDFVPVGPLMVVVAALSNGPKGVTYRDGYKAVHFQEYDTVPENVEIQHQDEPIDPDYFREEETIKNGDGEESE